MLACQSKYPDLKNIKIQEADGTTDISIKTIEKIVTEEPLKRQFSGLNPNEITDKDALQKALSKEPPSLERDKTQELITNPNWKIKK
jgi:hypothetical protein